MCDTAHHQRARAAALPGGVGVQVDESSTPTPSYQSVKPKPACAVQRAMTNAMLNCIPEQGNKWRNALQWVYEVSDNHSHNEHLSADLSTWCMESHRLSTGGVDTGGWLKCRLSAFTPLESAMLDRVMRDSNMATGDSGSRTIRPPVAVVGLGLASGPLSGVELVIGMYKSKRDVHIEMTRRDSRPPLKATLFVADQSGKDDVMRFHVDSPHAVTAESGPPVHRQTRALSSQYMQRMCACVACVKLIYIKLIYMYFRYTHVFSCLILTLPLSVRV